jgi:hypothetical protein
VASSTVRYQRCILLGEFANFTCSRRSPHQCDSYPLRRSIPRTQYVTPRATQHSRRPTTFPSRAGYRGHRWQLQALVMSPRRTITLGWIILIEHDSWLDCRRRRTRLWATRRCECEGTIDQPGFFGTNTDEKYVGFLPRDSITALTCLLVPLMFINTLMIVYLLVLG